MQLSLQHLKSTKRQPIILLSLYTNDKSRPSNRLDIAKTKKRLIIPHPRQELLPNNLTRNGRTIKVPIKITNKHQPLLKSIKIIQKTLPKPKK
jgi:hypothetical protein